MQTKLNYGIKRLFIRILLSVARESVFINYKIRRFLLKKAGIKIGRNVFIGENVFFDELNLSGITIGDNSFVTRDVKVLSHFLNTKKFIFENGDVKIGENVFIGVGTIIAKPVKIGSNVIIGAGSIIVTDIPENCIAAGNPCKMIKLRS